MGKVTSTHDQMRIATENGPFKPDNIIDSLCQKVKNVQLNRAELYVTNVIPPYPNYFPISYNSGSHLFKT